MGTFPNNLSKQIKSNNETMKSFACILAIIGMTAAKSLSANGVSQSQRMTVGNFTSRSKAAAQLLTCYDYNNGGGDSVRATDYIPALRNYNFDNRISSAASPGPGSCTPRRTT